MKTLLIILSTIIAIGVILWLLFGDVVKGIIELMEGFIGKQGDRKD